MYFLGGGKTKKKVTKKVTKQKNIILDTFRHEILFKKGLCVKKF